MKKKFVTGLAVALLITGFGASAGATSSKFKDSYEIPNWSKFAVDELVGREVIQGDTAGYFLPHDDVTRASAAQMIYKARDLDISGEAIYDDVKEKDWFYDAVRTVTKEGIFKGDGKGNFNPNKNLTREQAAATLVRAFGFEAEGVLDLPDAKKVSDWAKKEAAIVHQLGIVKGTVNKNGEIVFAPQDNITRAQFATMLNRAIQIVEEGEVNEPTPPPVEPILEIEQEKMKEGFTFSEEGLWGLEGAPHPESQALTDQFLRDLKIDGYHVTGKIPNIPDKYRLFLTIEEGTEVKKTYHKNLSHLKPGESFSYTLRNDVEDSRLSFGIFEGIVGINSLYIDLRNKVVQWGNHR